MANSLKQSVLLGGLFLCYAFLELVFLALELCNPEFLLCLPILLEQVMLLTLHVHEDLH